MQSYKTLQIKATKIASYISIINSLRVVHVGLSNIAAGISFSFDPEQAGEQGRAGLWTRPFLLRGDGVFMRRQ